MKAVILAAGMGSRLAPLTNDRPKPLVPVAGRPLLLRTLERLGAVGLSGRDVIVVGGFREDVLRRTLAESGHGEVVVVTNEKYDSWNNWYSLLVAREAIGGDDVLQLDGDVLFDEKVLPRVLAHQGPALLAIDVRDDLPDEAMKVTASDPARRRIDAVSKKLDAKRSVGEYIGVTRLDAAIAARVFDELARFPELGVTGEYYEHAFHRLAGRGEGPFWVCDVADCLTIEIDDQADLRRAEELLAERRPA